MLEKLEDAGLELDLISNLKHRGYCFAAKNFKWVEEDIGVIDFMSDGTVEVNGETLLYKKDNVLNLLSKSFYDLLRYMASKHKYESPENYLSHEQLTSHLNTNKGVVRNKINYLRGSLSLVTGMHKEAFIETIWGKGYRFHPNPDATLDPKAAPRAEHA